MGVVMATSIQLGFLAVKQVVLGSISKFSYNSVLFNY